MASPLSILHPNTIAGAIISKRKGSNGFEIDSTPVRRHEETEEEQDRYKDSSEEGGGLTACANDLIKSVHAKDATGVVSALKAAFELMESEPHEESENEEEIE